MITVLLAVLGGALVYSVLSVVASARYLAVHSPTLTTPEPVSILKPLAGLDLDLESNLRTFFKQDYPTFEILFAVSQATDPAVAVVEKLQREYSKVATRLLVTAAYAVSWRVLRAKLNWWLLPIEDLLAFCFWIAGFFGNTITSRAALSSSQRRPLRAASVFLTPQFLTKDRRATICLS